MADAEAVQGGGPHTPIADVAHWISKSFGRLGDTIGDRFDTTEITGFDPAELPDMDCALTHARDVCLEAFAVLDRAKIYGYGSASYFFRGRLGAEFTRTELQDHLAREGVPPLEDADLFTMFLEDWAEWFKEDMGREGQAVGFMEMPVGRGKQPAYSFYLRPQSSESGDSSGGSEHGQGRVALAAVYALANYRRGRPHRWHMPHGA